MFAKELTSGDGSPCVLSCNAEKTSLGVGRVKRWVAGACLYGVNIYFHCYFKFLVKCVFSIPITTILFFGIIFIIFCLLINDNKTKCGRIENFETK